MLLQNQNRNPIGPGRKGRRGQALVESALVVLVFLACLIGALDFGQLLFTHQMMVDRVRAGVRWGVVNAWDGTGNQIANMVLYNNTTAGSNPFLGMNRDNVSVVRTAGTVDNPNDERITVSIVNYNFTFLSPWIAHTYTGNNVAVETGVMLYKP